jgi:hypothetical protein
MALLLVACSGPGGASPDPDRGQAPNPDTEETDTTDGTTTGAPADDDCAVPAGQAFMEGDVVDVPVIGHVDGVEVRAAMYPHPDYEGNPWSQWGQGMVATDGSLYSAIGDHIGVDGNSYVYEYDPAAHELSMVGDILSYVDHVPGTFGYGKVHSQMVPGPCGEIYFSTYWGTFRDIAFEGNYRGDLLFRLDPRGRAMSPLEVPVEFHGQASLGAHAPSGLIYGEAIDPVLKNDDIDRGPFFVYDLVAQETSFVGPVEPHVGYRSVLVDGEGRAYYSIGGAQLSVFDPGTGELDTHDATLPGDWLRAVTDPAPDGSVYGVTREPDTFFVMRPDGSIEELGAALGYTASLALSPDGSAFYYMPGAHGDSASWGSPLVRVDTGTGEQTVVAELNDVVEEALGYTVGGTFNVVASPDGNTVYMGVNAGPAGSDETFAEVILLVIELP